MKTLNERGQVTVMAVGLTLLAIAVAGIAVDGTRAFLMRRSLQNAADAAALAAASEIEMATYYDSGGDQIVIDARAAENAARSSLSGRGLPARIELSVDDSAVEVALLSEVRTGFLRLVGIAELPVAVEARAEPVAGAAAGS